MALKLKKSAGVKVTLPVHRTIRSGNQARDQRDWERAADAYREALLADPSLRHIWIQLGHALKEAGAREDAVAAYLRAAELDPGSPEPWIHIAHLHKTRGDKRAAARVFVEAIRVGPGDASAAESLHVLLGSFGSIDRHSIRAAVREAAQRPGMIQVHRAQAGETAAALTAILERLGGEADPADVAAIEQARGVLQHLEDRGAGPAAAQPVPIVFDLSDLVAHFRNQRLPTGIQRVQVEVVTRALGDPCCDARICCFIDGRDDFLEIPADIFMSLAELSTSGKDSDDPAWRTAVTRLFIHLFISETMSFRSGECLINLGTSWWIHNYFLLIRNAKRDFAIRYVPFVHDLIPAVVPAYCVWDVTEDYLCWLVGVFDHADLFLANSQSTRRDLLRSAKRLGHKLAEDEVKVVTLDADFRRPPEHDLRSDVLDQWNLADKPYCLLVSTIEARKNHVLALEAWAALIERHGPDAVPLLVCVGRRGWLNEAFYDRLSRDPQLAGHVRIVDRVSDDELALIYRHCLCTTYPSHYEGWGLPITESLCYGKVPVVAANSSLTEAGGGFAEYFEADSVPEYVEALTRILFDAEYRERREDEIARQFRPRGWSSIARQVIDAAVEASTVAASPAEPTAIVGRYYPVSRFQGGRIWRDLGSGEVFRTGAGWHWPQSDGTRTRPQGGELRFRTEGQGKHLRLYMMLRGLAGADAGFRISMNGITVRTGALAAGQQRWTLADLPPADDGIVSLHIQGFAQEQVEMNTGGTVKRVEASISVIGFAVLDRDDADMRMEFTEAVMLGGLDRVHAFVDREEGFAAVARDSGGSYVGHVKDGDVGASIAIGGS